LADADQAAARWRANLRLTAGLLLVWAGVSFGVALFARELGFAFLGAPFAVWVASQGALVVFLAIVWAYARRIERIEKAAQDGIDDFK
jgi:putative solute:sodium symporter small subunit